MNGRVNSSTLDFLSEFLSRHMGLFFSPERRLDLLRGIRNAADAFGFKDVNTFIRWIMAGPLNRRQIEVLARYLTVGETYFMREKKVLEALSTFILPNMIQTCKRESKPLRIWSAGCCTGEEPYTIAMLIDQISPGISSFGLEIIATDINTAFLRKAERGIYTEWSFRGTPAFIRDRYFRAAGKGEYQISEHIRRHVNFGYLNLAADTFPGALQTDLPIDIILCRNVLMYFKPERLKDIVRRFYASLHNDGWLAVGPSESSHVNFSQYQSVEFPGAILYKKNDRNIPAGAVIRQHAKRKAICRPIKEWSSVPAAAVPRDAKPAPAPQAPEKTPGTGACGNDIYAEAACYYQKADYQAVTRLIAEGALHNEQAADVRLLLLAARSYANLGNTECALRWVDEAISSDKMNPDAHHLRANLLQETNRLDEAAASLRKVLYLDPEYLMAHFMLGTLYSQRGRRKESERHFNNTLQLLKDTNPDSVLPDTDGMTAAGLSDCIHYLKNKDLRA